MPSKDKEKQAGWAKTHYLANKDAVKQRAAAFTIEARKRNTAFVWNYLESHPCIDCGETDPVVLEFDHRDTAEKLKEVSYLIRNPSSIEAITKEMAKCDVRCANCHRRKTAKQFGWYGSLLKE